MKMDFNSRSIFIVLGSLVISFKVVLSMPVGSPFTCGPVMCNRKGFDRCIAPPLIGAQDRPYCLRCEEPDAKCGTIEEIGDCNLFCHGVILERELEKGIGCNNTASILLIVMVVVMGGCLVAVSVYAIGLKRQLWKHTRENVDSLGSSTIHSADNVDEETVLNSFVSQPFDDRETPVTRPRPDFTAMPPTEMDRVELVPN